MRSETTTFPLVLVDFLPQSSFSLESAHSSLEKAVSKVVSAALDRIRLTFSYLLSSVIFLQGRVKVLENRVEV